MDTRSNFVNELGRVASFSSSKKYPILKKKIDTLYTIWGDSLPESVDEDTSFVPVHPPGPAAECSANSLCTPLHRILPLRSANVVQPRTLVSASTALLRDRYPAVGLSSTPHQPSSKNHPPGKSISGHASGRSDVKRLLTSKALGRLYDDESSRLGPTNWTEERISAWAEGCVL